MTTDDHQLLIACLEGDASAQEALVHRFSNLIFHSIQATARVKNITLSQQELEDLHGSVFLQLFDRQCHRLRMYRGNNGCSLASWIRIITQRSVLDHFRRTQDALACPDRLMPLDMIFDLASQTPSALSRLEDREKHRLIEAGLEALCPRDQLMIRMHCMEGCSLKAMAKVLKITQNNVHSVKHRAVQRLAEAIETIAEKQLKDLR